MTRSRNSRRGKGCSGWGCTCHQPERRQETRQRRYANRQAPERELAEWDKVFYAGLLEERNRFAWRDYDPWDDVEGVLPETQRHWFEEWVA